MKDFRDLKVWHLAHQITLDCYRVTAKFPSEEKFGLTSQLRRAAAAVGANIAEGAGRRGNGEFHRFLQIAAGSVSEVEYHLLLSRDLGFLNDDQYVDLNSRTLDLKRMLAALITKVDGERIKTAAAGKSGI